MADNTQIQQAFQEVKDFIDLKFLALCSTPAPPPEPKKLLSVYQFFGPAQGGGALTQTPLSVLAFQGNALSASTKLFCFDYGLAEVALARLFVVWAPGSSANQLELSNFDGGMPPTNFQQMAVVNGVDTNNPQTIDADVTGPLNALVTAKARKHLGFRIKGSAQYTLYEVRLEVYWKLPA